MANYISNSTKSDPKDGKIKITPRFVFNAIVKNSKETLYFSLLFCAAIAVLCVPFLLALYLDSPFNEQWTALLKVLMFGAVMLPVAGCILRFFIAVSGTSRGKYTVVTDIVERVVPEDRLVYKFGPRGGHYRYEHAIYLRETRRVVVSYMDINSYSEDDMLYLIVRKKRPNAPIAVYNAKSHELSDSE